MSAEWSILNMHDHRFDFTAPSVVLETQIASSTLNADEWSALSSSTSFYPGASAAMSAFTTVANLRRIVGRLRTEDIDQTELV